MTYIRISITINEEKIRGQIIKSYKAIETYAQHHYREAFIYANELGTRHGASPVLAGIHKLLNHIRTDLTGTIACDCRRRSCPGYTLSVRTFAKKMKEVS